jgi:hypothetical protein
MRPLLVLDAEGMLSKEAETSGGAQPPASSRLPNYAAEDMTFSALGLAALQDGDTLLQRLSRGAMELTDADSAGVSLLQTNGQTQWFQWRATSGRFAEHLGATMPSDASPCALVLQRNATLLLTDPVKEFPEIAKLCAPVCEVLLAPFHRDGVPIGTVWAVSHSVDKHFGVEEARLLTKLATFASQCDVVKVLAAAGLIRLDDVGTLRTTLQAIDALAQGIVERLR